MIEQLPEILERLKQKFRKTIVAVALHGSTLKKPVAHDIDLLVIAKSLPSGWKERFELVKPAKEDFLKKGIVLDIKLCTPEEFERATTESNALMLSISERHEILYDTNGYFADSMAKFKRNVAFKYVYQGDGVWEALKT